MYTLHRNYMYRWVHTAIIPIYIRPRVYPQDDGSHPMHAHTWTRTPMVDVQVAGEFTQKSTRYSVYSAGGVGIRLQVQDKCIHNVLHVTEMEPQHNGILWKRKKYEQNEIFLEIIITYLKLKLNF